MVTLSTLSLELQVEVLSYLDLPTLKVLMLTNKKFRELAASVLFRDLTVLNLGNFPRKREGGLISFDLRDEEQKLYQERLPRKIFPISELDQELGEVDKSCSFKERVNKWFVSQYKQHIREVSLPSLGFSISATYFIKLIHLEVHFDSSFEQFRPEELEVFSKLVWLKVQFDEYVPLELKFFPSIKTLQKLTLKGPNETLSSFQLFRSSHLKYLHLRVSDLNLQVFQHLHNNMSNLRTLILTVEETLIEDIVVEDLPKFPHLTQFQFLSLSKQRPNLIQYFTDAKYWPKVQTYRCVYEQHQKNYLGDWSQVTHLFETFTQWDRQLNLTCFTQLLRLDIDVLNMSDGTQSFYYICTAVPTLHHLYLRGGFCSLVCELLLKNSTHFGLFNLKTFHAMHIYSDFQIQVLLRFLAFMTNLTNCIINLNRTEDMQSKLDSLDSLDLDLKFDNLVFLQLWFDRKRCTPVELWCTKRALRLS